MDADAEEEVEAVQAAAAAEYVRCARGGGVAMFSWAEDRVAMMRLDRDAATMGVEGANMEVRAAEGEAMAAKMEVRAADE